MSNDPDPTVVYVNTTLAIVPLGYEKETTAPMGYLWTYLMRNSNKITNRITYCIANIKEPKKQVERLFGVYYW